MSETKFVKVTFDYGVNRTKHYVFKYTDDLNLHVGDMVVVDTVNGYMIATVRYLDVVEPSHVEVKKYVVSKVDIKAHADRLRRDKAVKEIEAKLAERRKVVEGEVIHQWMLKADRTYAELVQELEAVKNS